MRLRAVGALAALVGIAAGIGAAAPGCDSGGDGAGGGTLTQCLPTLTEANGSACALGDVCAYPFTCGSFSQEVSCTCPADGFFQCAVFGSDASLPSSATPTCSPATNPSACPASEPRSRSACAGLGLECLYADDECPGSDGGANIDTCVCQGGEDGGLAFACVQGECFVAPDAGDAAVDGPGSADAGDGGDEEGAVDGGASDAGDGAALDAGDAGDAAG